MALVTIIELLESKIQTSEESGLGLPDRESTESELATWEKGVEDLAEEIV
jgi:hypothetical protein